MKRLDLHIPTLFHIKPFIIRISYGSTTKSDSTENHSAFWNISAEQQLQQLTATRQGLTNEEANLRIKRYGANRLNNKKEAGNVQLFFAQFKSSIILILLFATGLSFFLHDRLDAAIILTIVLISGCLGFWQEKGAANAVKKLLAMVQITVSVLRDGIATEIATRKPDSRRYYIAQGRGYYSGGLFATGIGQSVC